MSRQRSAGAGREVASVETGGLRRGTAGGAAEPVSRTCSHSGSRQTPSSRGFPWHGSEKARGEGSPVPFSGAKKPFRFLTPVWYQHFSGPVLNGHRGTRCTWEPCGRIKQRLGQAGEQDFSRMATQRYGYLLGFFLCVI